MRIAQAPFRAEIVPHASPVHALWHCIIQREGSTEVITRLEAMRKEDARCIALLELSRLQPPGGVRRPA
ncbi:MAG TPA: hypothetical protein VNW97_05275 [Candidatus Saccharimonadales bacterium]|jgi:hypothetical protein|nr:hypothetical protein [Candidatus Saccharimonadales bacterium]